MLSKLRVYWHNYNRTCKTCKTMLKLKKEKKIPKKKKKIPNRKEKQARILMNMTWCDENNQKSRIVTGCRG